MHKSLDLKGSPNVSEISKRKPKPSKLFKSQNIKIKEKNPKSFQKWKKLPINKEALDWHEISHWHYWILEISRKY